MSAETLIKPRAMRDALLSSLHRAMQSDSDLFFVTADFGSPVLDAIRADRAWGFYIRNLTVERTEFNGLYVIETDGYVIDSILARWDLEYGFLTFTVDHGLWENCETYGNGDSGLYPGAGAKTDHKEDWDAGVRGRAKEALERIGHPLGG